MENVFLGDVDPNQQSRISPEQREELRNRRIEAYKTGDLTLLDEEEKARLIKDMIRPTSPVRRKDGRLYKVTANHIDGSTKIVVPVIGSKSDDSFVADGEPLVVSDDVFFRDFDIVTSFN